MGVAKLVADSGTTDTAFVAAISVLQLVVSETCQDSVVSALSEEVRVLRQCLDGIQKSQAGSGPAATSSSPPIDPASVNDMKGHGAALAFRAIAYLQHHYQDPSLSLSAVAKALGCNPRYLTTRFTKVVGERMHTYLLTLRVGHACQLLIGSGQLVKEIAMSSGFSGPGRLVSVFRRHVGVSPAEYRRIFSRS